MEKKKQLSFTKQFIILYFCDKHKPNLLGIIGTRTYRHVTLTPCVDNTQVTMYTARPKMKSLDFKTSHPFVAALTRTRSALSDGAISAKNFTGCVSGAARLELSRPPLIWGSTPFFLKNILTYPF